MVIDVGSCGEENAWGMGSRAGLILSTDNILQQIQAIDADDEAIEASEVPPVNNEGNTVVNEPPPPEEISVIEPSIAEVHFDSEVRIYEL